MKLREVYQNKLRHLAFGIGKPEEVIEVGTQAGIQEEQLKQDIASAVTTADLLRKSFSARNSLLTDFARELPPLTQAEIDNNIYWLQLSRLSGDNESIDFFGRSVPKEEVKNLVKDKDVSEEEVVEAGVKAGIPKDQLQEDISRALHCRYLNKLIQLKEVSEGKEVAFVKGITEAGLEAGVPENQIQSWISAALSFRKA